MLHRIGISISDAELKLLKGFQKRFGASTRSEAFRELLKHFEQMEKEKFLLLQCAEGYRAHPETEERSTKNEDFMPTLPTDEGWS